LTERSNNSISAKRICSLRVIRSRPAAPDRPSPDWPRSPPPPWACGRLVFHILGAIDEFQRELIIEGTREGLEVARARGRLQAQLNGVKAATVRRM
jgi:hypothetical protein